MRNKKIDDSFERITSWENTMLALSKSLKGKHKYKGDAMEFNARPMYNTILLREMIKLGLYRHYGYRMFEIMEYKKRVIYAPKYIDKIVQHMVNNVLINIYEPLFIYDSYACIRGKGNQAAVWRIQEMQRRARHIYLNPTFLKLDISKFFYTIDRDILKIILRKKIIDPRTLNLLDIIIDSFDEPLGLPLGNLTSQLFANIYLNEIDQLIKRKYKVKLYVRYADDMFLIVDGRENARELKDMIIKDITEMLKLTVNSKKVYISNYDIIHGLGFKITPSKITLLGRNRRKLRKLLKKGDIVRLNSWAGFAKTGSCYALIDRYIDKSKLLFDGKFTKVEDG